MNARARWGVLREQRYAIALCLMSLFGACISCDQEDRWVTTYAMVAVDSLLVPAQASTSDTLCVRFESDRCHSCCWQFDRFEVERDSLSIRFVLWGKDTRLREGQGDCRNLPGCHWLDEEYCLQDVFPGMLHIAVLQPDGSVLRDSVLIDPDPHSGSE